MWDDFPVVHWVDGVTVEKNLKFHIRRTALHPLQNLSLDWAKGLVGMGPDLKVINLPEKKSTKPNQHLSLTILPFETWEKLPKWNFHRSIIAFKDNFMTSCHCFFKHWTKDALALHPRATHRWYRQCQPYYSYQNSIRFCRLYWYARIASINNPPRTMRMNHDDSPSVVGKSEDEGHLFPPWCPVERNKCSLFIVVRLVTFLNVFMQYLHHPEKSN